MSAVRVLFAEDHPLFRDGIRQMIEGDDRFDLVFETGDGLEALEQARKDCPDVALLDLNLPGMKGLDIARARLAERLDFRIAFLTMCEEKDLFNEAINLGAEGYILKDSTAEEICSAILSVSQGKLWVSRPLVGFLVDRSKEGGQLEKKVPGLAGLSLVERKILKRVASDMTTKQIAQEFGLSHRTIDKHRANISSKLGIKGSHSLLKFAFENRDKL